MKIILPIHGEDMVFSEKELIDILEKHYFEKPKSLRKVIRAETGPIQGEAFYIDADQINKKLFEQPRVDKNEEYVRKYILKAFKEIEEYPERYKRYFKTFIPKKKWASRNIREFQEYAIEKNSHIADWVEQSLEWAQRISNGESWETLCSKPDTQSWYRLVEWRYGKYRNVGGTLKGGDKNWPTYVSNTSYSMEHSFLYAVPLLVLE